MSKGCGKGCDKSSKDETSGKGCGTGGKGRDKSSKGETGGKRRDKGNKRRKKGGKREKVLSVAILPRGVRCFEGALEFSLPADCRFLYGGDEKDAYRFCGAHCELLVMRMRFSVPLRRVTAADLRDFLGPVFGARAPKEITYGFLRHSPTLTARWDSPRCTLFLAQVRDTVFLMRFSNFEEAGANAITQSVQLRPERVGQRTNKSRG